MSQVYPTIANPFMPQGTPDKTNAASPIYAPGELGCQFYDQNTGGRYLRVQLDSGATSATSVGAVVAGQIAYWKNQAASGGYLVTNDKNQCDLGPAAAINRIAGIFQLAVTTAPNVNGPDGNPSLYTTDLVITKNAFNVAASGSLTAGGYATANTSASTANAISTTAGTAPPSQTIGVWTSATTSTVNAITVGTCNVNIAFSD